MGDLRIVLDMRSAERACCFQPQLEPILEQHSRRIAANATALGSGFKTAKWHDHETGETKGGKSPAYGSDVYKGKRGYVGIVHPENYAAMKDNHLHNTMLKAAN